MMMMMMMMMMMIGSHDDTDTKHSAIKGCRQTYILDLQFMTPAKQDTPCQALPSLSK